MSSVFTLGGIALVVVGGLAVWLLNKPESQDKVEDLAASQEEETSQHEVIN